MPELESSPPKPKWRRRSYQRQCLEVVAGLRNPQLVTGESAVGPGEIPRCWLLLWRRQGGKSTTLAEVSLLEMMRNKDRMVTYASASLLLGRELIYKEAAVLQSALPRLETMGHQARVRLETTDGRTGRPVSSGVELDDFASLFQAQRLEFRLWHDRSHCARTRIIAPNPATARGWTGTVLLDEFGFIRDLQELWEAIEPIVSTDRSFRLIGATTPPSDDAHFSYTLTEPAPGTEFPVHTAGNWYRSGVGKLVHRVDVFDAYRAGLHLYDLDTGSQLTPEEHRKRALDTDAWRRNYGIVHIRGGTAAVGLPELESAQLRGKGMSRFFRIETPEEWMSALDWARDQVTDGGLGLGWDLGTTESERSNPSAIAVLEHRPGEWIVRVIAVWKTVEPQLARMRVRQLIEAISRPGNRARRLCVDSSNERYFAAEVRRELAPVLPVELIQGNGTIVPPGQASLPYKVYLGHRLLQLLEINQLTLPPEPYVKADFRRIRRDRGSFFAETGPEGEHGDTFDATKLAVHAVEGRLGGAGTGSDGIRVGKAQYRPSRLNR